MRLHQAEFRILQHLRAIPAFQGSPGIVVHLLLSGGKDSVALFQILHRLQCLSSDWSLINFFLIAHHFNHKRRSPESDADEDHCVDLARRCGTPLQIWRWSPELDCALSAGTNFQSLARDWRYQSSEKFAREHAPTRTNQQPAWILASAHHRRDHAETILHNIARGCSTDGLKGQSPWSLENRRLRPLLWLPSELCDAYIASKEWPHREDSSNSETDYTRNRIRHRVLKELEIINPKVIEHIWNLSQDVRQDSTERLRPTFFAAKPIQSISSVKDLQRFIAENHKTKETQISRELLNNIFTHLQKCLRTPRVSREYNFALSDGVALRMTNQHLEITTTLKSSASTHRYERGEL